jgi:mono/diheme cytochrome c family protein
VLLIAAACEPLAPNITWERMIDQPRGKAFRASPYFPDGKLMQAPVEGTVPVTAPVGPTEETEGTSGADYVSTLPMPIDRALLVRGRNRFDTFCATCHGLDGSGDSLVGQNMQLRQPPSLVVEPVRSFAVGRLFHIAGAGYGLMPGYSAELPIRDRWAVVAYVRALQRSQASALASLPAAARKRAEEALR